MLELDHFDLALLDVLQRFGRATHQQLGEVPEVLECHAVVGDADYLLRIVAPDLNALSQFVMKKLMRVPGVDSVRSNIVLTTFKRNGALPLAHLAPGAA